MMMLRRWADFSLPRVADCSSAKVSGQKFANACRFEPTPQEFDRIELRCITGQEMKLNLASGRSDVVAHQVAAMWPGVVPDDEQWAAAVSAERLEELGDLFFSDAAFMQPKAQPAEVHTRDQRQLMPVEVELHDRWVSPRTPQVRTRVGRSETPDSSMKTISRPWRAAFFLAPAKCAGASARWRQRRVPGRVDRASGWTSPAARASASSGPRCTARRTRVR